MSFDATNVVTLLVAIIAAVSAVASQRASAKAAAAAKIETAKNELANSRVDMEKSAYERARAFDTETIVRQNKRIAELSREVRYLKKKCETLSARLDKVDHPDDPLEDFDSCDWIDDTEEFEPFKNDEDEPG